MKVEGRELSVDDYLKKVTYVPNHANGNAGHPDCEQGVIIRWTDEVVFVLYCKGRTVQATQPENLVFG